MPVVDKRTDRPAAVARVQVGTGSPVDVVVATPTVISPVPVPVPVSGSSTENGMRPGMSTASGPEITTSRSNSLKSTRPRLSEVPTMPISTDSASRTAPEMMSPRPRRGTDGATGVGRTVTVSRYRRARSAVPRAPPV